MFFHAYRSALGRAALVLAALFAVACGSDDSSAPRAGDADDGSESESAADESKDPPKSEKAPDAGKSTPKPASDDAGKASAGSSAAGSQGSSEPEKSAPAAESTPVESKSLWCDVLAVARTSCQECHGASLAAGAPMPLLTYDDFVKEAPVTKGKKVYEVVKSRAHDAKRPMPPTTPLGASELLAIDAWIAAGAVAGDDPRCTGLAEAPVETERPWPPVGCTETYKVLVGNGKKVSVAPGSETHPQFIIDAPWGDVDVQAIGFRPITDNKAVLHHWILNSNVGTRAFLNGWAPGQDNTKGKPLPEDVGVFLPKGARSLRLDTHYNNLTGTKVEEDQSGVEICVTRNLRKYSATTFGSFSGLPILPPGQETDIVGTCNVSVKQPTFLLSESPHAHKLATHMKLVLKRDGQETILHDAAFAFDGQVATSFDKPVELKNGDQVITTCHYNNDTSKTVTFGENTGNEMCFNFASYYPMGSLSCSGGGGLPAFAGF